MFVVPARAAKFAKTLGYGEAQCVRLYRDQLSTLQNPAVDFATVGYTDDVNDDFCYVYLVYDSVGPD